MPEASRMASRTPQTDESPPKGESLSMQIYAAMLGNEPAFDCPASRKHPRLKMRVRLEAKLEHAGASPFFRTTLREHVERCAAYAVRALDEARERLSVAHPKPIETLRETSDPSGLKPVVLVGSAATKRRRSTDSRAA
jgi:hypothetical protein